MNVPKWRIGVGLDRIYQRAIKTIQFQVVRQLGWIELVVGLAVMRMDDDILTSN